MKKTLLILLLVSLVFTLGAGWQALDTAHFQYYLLRTEANEDASTIDLTTSGNFANKPSAAERLGTRDDGTGHGGNAIELIFCGGDAADDTFTYTVYAWRRGNGPARMVATGTGTLGTQAVVVYPQGGTATSKFWADTLSVTHRWLTTVASTDTAGNNEVASLVFDMCGYEWIYTEITNADGTGTEAQSVSVYYSYF